MKRNIFFLCALLAGAGVLTGCSATDGSEDEPSDGGQRTWRVDIHAGPGVDGATRAVGLDSDGKLCTTWTEGDAVTALAGTSVAGTLSAHIPATDLTYARLRGDLTGSFAVGDAIGLWYGNTSVTTVASVSYEDQSGALADVSRYFAWLTATSEVTAVDDVAGTLTMSDVSFVHEQAFLDLRFTDRTGTALAISELSVWAASGKLVRSVESSGTKAYFSESAPLVVTPATATDRFFLSLRDEEGTNDVFYFVATTSAGTYACWVRSPLLYGHYYTGSLRMSSSAIGRDDYEGGSWESSGTGIVGREDYNGGTWDDLGTVGLGRSDYGLGGTWDSYISGRTGRTDYGAGGSLDSSLSGSTGRTDYGAGGSW